MSSFAQPTLLHLAFLFSLIRLVLLSCSGQIMFDANGDLSLMPKAQYLDWRTVPKHSNISLLLRLHLEVKEVRGEESWNIYHDY